MFEKMKLFRLVEMTLLSEIKATYIIHMFERSFIQKTNKKIS